MDAEFKYRLKAFVKYILTEPFIQSYQELRDIWIALSNKRVWILMWAGLFAITAIGQKLLLSVICFILFLFFLVTYLWAKGDYIHTDRIKTYKKLGVEPPKPQKDTKI